MSESTAPDLDAIRDALAKVRFPATDHIGCDRPDCAWHRGPEWLAWCADELQALADRVRAAEHIANSFCANFECDKAKAVDRCPAMVLGERIVAALRPGAPREEGA